ncbi:MAG TPA: DNA-formamidopyrimidine glycosylase family protein [Flavisolibacter sp.]|nr:DNA-formamidopyrimidine glycosylase family protein [Flavisolibacter sp.]
MPELPDLQVFSHNLDKKLAGKKVKKVTVVNDSKIKQPVAKFKNLEGATLKKVYREGKELRFEFNDENVLGLHLMLHGKLHLFENTNEQKNTIIELLFTDDTGLALTDYQGIATPTLNPEEKDSPDALSKEVNFDFLKTQLSKKRATIKNFLLDQKMIRGIGNAYADEILWDAGISPFSVCNKIPDEKIKTLSASIRSVLQDAEKQIKKSNPDIISGEVRDFLNIHNAKKKHSPTGGVIHNKMVSSRITYYTDEQELFG